jgi:2-iminobutanoate/2-iminopropanoate deaminase
LINAVYGSYFDADGYPARETVEVSCLPKNARIEITVTAMFE